MDRARTRTMAIVALAAVVAAVLVMADGTRSSPGHPYLALGDSVTFGYITQAGFEYRNPDNFIGYPTSATGYPAMYQAALAVCVRYATNQAKAQAAWAAFQKWQRIDYSTNGKYDVQP